LNIDPLKLKEKINEKTRAIMPVHLFGLPADMDEIMDIAKEYNLKVIEDCAQAFGAHYRGRPVGSIGDAGCFSFYPSKNLGGYGDGGMMITSNPDIHETVRLLRNHGSYFFNDTATTEIYTSLIKEAGEAVQCPTEVTYSKHVYHQYTIRSSKRINIQEALQSNSASSVVYYPTPLHLQKAFRYLGYRENDFPESESASREALSLPMYPELEPGKAKFIAEIVVRAVG
jgi:dTDP-4-amino-4,6-dideoxygalactose transaminase